MDTKDRRSSVRVSDVIARLVMAAIIVGFLLAVMIGTAVGMIEAFERGL